MDKIGSIRAALQGDADAALFEKLCTACPGGIAPLAEGDLGAAQPGILRRHALGACGASETLGARRQGTSTPRPFADRRRAAIPRGKHAARRRIGARDTAVHPHRLALRACRVTIEGAGHACCAARCTMMIDPLRPPRRPRCGTTTGYLPVRSAAARCTGRGDRRRRLGFVAVHHGAAAGAAGCSQHDIHAPRAAAPSRPPIWT